MVLVKKKNKQTNKTKQNKPITFETRGGIDSLITAITITIVGFHMTSPKCKLKNYRSYRDFTFMMH